MGWRETGEMHKPQPIKVRTCDQCGSDIGTLDGYGSKYPYFQLDIHNHKPACEDDGSMTYLAVCSPPCLVKIAGRIAAGERIESAD